MRAAGTVFLFAACVVCISAQADQAVPLGDTGYTVRVLRYLPHARVEDKTLVNASDRPVNPTIEDALFSVSALEVGRTIPIDSPDGVAGQGG